MNSLETIKQELINQKNELENKGFSVPISNRNPTPTEITSAIKNMDFDFTSTTATEEDVIAGKTFYSQTNEIKTGTLDTSIFESANEIFATYISGNGTVEIYIPANISRIREYAFYTTNTDNANLFHATDLVIPNNITQIGLRAFNRANITGKLTIPSTCKTIASYTFTECKLKELYIDGGISTSSTFIFSDCKKLTKVTLGPNITTSSQYIFSSCSALQEVTILCTKATLVATTFYGCSNLKTITFTSTTPCTLKNNVLTDIKTTTLLVPYDCYDTYFNATNYQVYNNPMYGYGNFSAGRSLPDTLDDYTIVWYASLDDLTNNLNPITTTTTEGTYYGVFTSTAT